MSTDNRVILSFEKSLSNLAGYEFGIKTYEEQIKGKLNFEEPFVLEFPEQIKVVASSFVQGLFHNIVNQIGLLATEERVQIKSNNEKLVNTFLQKLQ